MADLMQSRSNTFLGLFAWLTRIFGCFFCLHSAHGQDYLTPDDVSLRTEEASQETLKQSAGKATLRFMGLDVFPRMAVTAMYDDNLFITSSNRLSDMEWTISPGVTLAAGDVSLYLPGSVTLSQIRNLLNYSLLDDSSRPERYLAVDYTPSANLFIDHSKYDNVDHTAGFSTGYDFARLVTGLDLDFSRIAVKDNSIGSRVTRDMIDAKLRSRYELTDRSAFEINGQYRRLSYQNEFYQGYDEFLNEDWFDRKVGARLEIGAGIAFGFVYPQFSSDQTYQQAFLRAIYRLTGKLNVRAYAGAEWRHYGSGGGETTDPVFSVEAIYQPRLSTRLTLEGHQRTAPSFGADYNYQIFGFTAGVAQQLTGSLDAELICSYENVDYVRLSPGLSDNRSDGYLAIRANLGYEFNSHLKAVLFYNRGQDDSNLSRYTYANNLVGVRMSWRF